MTNRNKNRKVTREKKKASAGIDWEFMLYKSREDQINFMSRKLKSFFEV